MRAEKDAYGQEIWTHFKGKESFEIVERDDGYVSLSGGAKSYFAGYKSWPAYQKRAVRFAKGRVLDIGCGAGRVSLYLQKRGLDVTGIDNSPLAVKVCRLRGLKKAKIMPINDIDRLGAHSFDTVIMFGNNFGLFGSFKKARTLLRKLHKITSKKALIIAESLDPYDTDNPAHLKYHRSNRKRGRMPGQLRLRIRFGKYKGDWFNYLAVSKKEMKAILKDTGWRVRKFIDSKNYIYIALIEKV